MNKHINKGWARHAHRSRRFLRIPAVVRFSVLALVVATAGVGLTQSGYASAETAADYCSQYSDSKKVACNDGIRGADCSDYALTFDQETADICRKAQKAKKNGQITDTPVTTVTPNPCGSYSGDLLQACEGGRTYGQCNSSVATTDPELYQACQVGAGQDTNTPPPANNSSDAQAYKNAILLACAPYQNDTAAALWCLYGGLGQNGAEGKPKTVADCVNKPELKGSTTNMQACITGSNAGNAYNAIQSNGGNSSGSNDGFALLDQLDQVGNLTQYIDVLHAIGPNANTDTTSAADNNYGSYVNGAGNQQKIEVYPCATGDNCPALLWFNGGGWHVDDGNAEKIATGSADTQKGGDNSAEAPVGGGGNQRGYTVMSVTYRLGSSGVYYQLEDVLRGVRHVINNAGLYHIDPAKVAIGGDSAGGSLSLRAGASGKSGAKAMVGWSGPANAYTALFHSFASFLIGMDHSTCIPTDLAGAANITDLLNGGSGNVAEYGKGLSSNSFDDFTNLADGGSPIPLLTNILTAAQYAATTGQNVESLSKKIETLYNDGKPDLNSIQSSGMPSSLINLSTKKLVECIDNFNALSPALFASPETPPGFMAGFDNDSLVGPDQIYDMRDKLLSLGIEAQAYVLQGDPNNPQNAIGNGGNHLGYDSRFVCPMFNFLNHIMQPDKESSNPDCATGATKGEQTAQASSGGGGGGCTASYDYKSSAPKVKVRLAAVVMPDEEAHLVNPNAKPGDKDFQVYKIGPKQSSGGGTSSGGCSSSGGGGGATGGSNRGGGGTSNGSSCGAQTVAAKPPVVPPKFDPGPPIEAKTINPKPGPSNNGGCSSGGKNCINAVSTRLTGSLPICGARTIPLSA